MATLPAVIAWDVIGLFQAPYDFSTAAAAQSDDASFMMTAFRCMLGETRDGVGWKAVEDERRATAAPKRATVM